MRIFEESASADIAARIGVTRLVQASLAASLAVNVLLACTLLARGESVRTIVIPPRMSSPAELTERSVPASSTPPSGLRGPR